MILAEKSSEMPRPHGVADFILGLLSHRHAEGFRSSLKHSRGKASNSDLWSTSPGYL
jgi:hypothetical protein